MPLAFVQQGKVEVDRRLGCSRMAGVRSRDTRPNPSARFRCFYSPVFGTL